jgi:multidrug efflux pump subunit AcrB
VAAELAAELSEIAETGRAYLIGGQPRMVSVEPDPDRLAASGVTWTALAGALRSAAAAREAGTMVRDNRETRIRSGPPFGTSEDVARVVAGLRRGRPVYVSDVATVSTGRAKRRTPCSSRSGARGRRPSTRPAANTRP